MHNTSPKTVVIQEEEEEKEKGNDEESRSRGRCVCVCVWGFFFSPGNVGKAIRSMDGHRSARSPGPQDVLPCSENCTAVPTG